MLICLWSHCPQKRGTSDYIFFTLWAVHSYFFFFMEGISFEILLGCLGGNTKSNRTPPPSRHQKKKPITTDEFGIDGKSLGPGTHSSDVAHWKMRNGWEKRWEERQQGGGCSAWSERERAGRVRIQWEIYNFLFRAYCWNRLINVFDGPQINSSQHVCSARDK